MKRLHSPDVYDLESYRPEDPESFGFLLQVMIGTRGEEGEESFDVEVCSPAWLEKNLVDAEVVVARPYILMRSYSYRSLHAALDKYISGCSGPDWDSIALQLQKLGRWEFDNYQG